MIEITEYEIILNGVVVADISWKSTASYSDKGAVIGITSGTSGIRNPYYIDAIQNRQRTAQSTPRRKKKKAAS